MEYRDVQYTLEKDDRGGWQWAVVLGSPPTIKSGHAERGPRSSRSRLRSIGRSVHEGLGGCNRKGSRLDFVQERFQISCLNSPVTVPIVLLWNIGNARC
jgi:hypothetical protein